MVQNFLVIDDSRLSRMMVRAIIDEHRPGSHILEAPDGASALAVIKSGQVVDIALVDYNMPGLNGMETYAALAAIIDIPKRALLTANIQDDIRKQAEAAGITFMNKPVDENAIRQFITQ